MTHAILTCLLALALCGAAVPKGKRRAPQKVNWQFSEAPSVTLGVRDKYGELGSFSATFIVTAPTGRRFYKTITVERGDFGDVNFPDDFVTGAARGIANETGAFTWECVVNGETAVRGRFILENTTSLEIKRERRKARR